MSKLEYLDSKDWSLHVIDGENECVPDGWVLVPNKRYKFYYTNGQDFFWTCDKSDQYGELLWTRKMKEYLVERDGKYELVEAYHLNGGIEVPEGSEIAIKFKNPNFINNGIVFYKNNGFCYANKENKFKWMGGSKWNMEVLLDKNYYHNGTDLSHDILWQRNPSINDQYAEIEEVRQDSNVSNPKHYTSHPSGIECIEITRHHDFAIGNAIKYLWRAGLKDSGNEIQDLEKAAWYIQDKIKQLKGGK